SFIVWFSIAVLCFGPALMTLRRLGPVDGPYSLLAAFGLWTLISHARRLLSPGEYPALLSLAVLAVIVEGVRNFGTYESVVVRSGMEDLALSGFRYWLH